MDPESIPQGVSLVAQHSMSLAGSVMPIQMPVIAPIMETSDSHLYSVGGHIDPMNLTQSHQYLVHQHHQVHEDCNKYLNENVAPTYDEIFPALPKSFSKPISNRLEAY